MSHFDNVGNIIYNYIKYMADQMTQHAELDTVSTEMLIKELALREAAAGAAGALATQAELASRERHARDAQFAHDMARFGDTSVEIPADEQLAILSRFGQRLGYILPDLTPHQRLMVGFDADLDANPTARLYAAPLSDSFAARAKPFDRAKRTFAKTTFAKREDALVGPYDWTKNPPTNPSYVLTPHPQLVADPTAIVELGDDSFAVRYMTPHGTFEDRQTYVGQMLASGGAIEAEDGSLWTYSVLSPDVEQPKLTALTAAQLNPAQTPEILMMRQLLSQANGAPVADTQHANEVVCKVDEAGRFLSVFSLASVTYEAGYRTVLFDYAPISSSKNV